MNQFLVSQHLALVIRRYRNISNILKYPLDPVLILKSLLFPVALLPHRPYTNLLRGLILPSVPSSLGPAQPYHAQAVELVFEPAPFSPVPLCRNHIPLTMPLVFQPSPDVCITVPILAQAFAAAAFVPEPLPNVLLVVTFLACDSSASVPTEALSELATKLAIIDISVGVVLHFADKRRHFNLLCCFRILFAFRSYP